MAFTDYLTHSIEVWRRSPGTANDYGEKVDTWTKRADILGMIQPASGNQSREEAGILVTSSHTMFCLAGTNVKVGDKVKYSGSFYDVQVVMDAAGRAHHLECSINLIGTVNFS